MNAHELSLENWLREMKKEAQELLTLKAAVDSHEKWIAFEDKRDQWDKNCEDCKAQFEIRDNHNKLDNESHLYLIPGLEFSAVSNEDQIRVMYGHIQGYLTFFVKK